MPSVFLNKLRYLFASQHRGLLLARSFLYIGSPTTPRCLVGNRMSNDQLKLLNTKELMTSRGYLHSCYRLLHVRVLCKYITNFIKPNQTLWNIYFFEGWPLYGVTWSASYP